MHSNIEKANEAERTADRVAFGCRIPVELRERIRVMAQDTDSSSNDVATLLFERGFDQMTMVRGPHSALLIDIFVAVKGGRRVAMATLEALEKHLPFGELEMAMNVIRDKHTPARGAE